MAPGAGFDVAWVYWGGHVPGAVTVRAEAGDTLGQDVTMSPVFFTQYYFMSITKRVRFSEVG